MKSSNSKETEKSCIYKKKRSKQITLELQCNSQLFRNNTEKKYWFYIKYTTIEKEKNFASHTCNCTLKAQEKQTFTFSSCQQQQKSCNDMHN